MQKHIVVILALVASLNVSGAAYADALPGPGVQRSAGMGANSKIKRFVGERFVRTELFFGTARSDGLPPVTEAEFQNFLDIKITRNSPASHCAKGFAKGGKYD